jgi:hypothetical protein
MPQSPGIPIEDELLNAAHADLEKLAEFAKILFMLNGFRPGPLPDKYVVLCTKPDEEWCVAQLWADEEKPFRVLEGMRYGSAKDAEHAAEALLVASKASA